MVWAPRWLPIFKIYLEWSRGQYEQIKQIFVLQRVAWHIFEWDKIIYFNLPPTCMALFSKLKSLLLWMWIFMVMTSILDGCFGPNPDHHATQTLHQRAASLSILTIILWLERKILTRTHEGRWVSDEEKLRSSDLFKQCIAYSKFKCYIWCGNVISKFKMNHKVKLLTRISIFECTSSVEVEL